MYKIWLVNFSYYSQHEFDNLEDAIKWARSTSFDCRIDKDGTAVCSVSYFNGVRYFQPPIELA